MSQPSTAIDPAPRPLTPAAARAAWREAEVRGILLVALGVLFVIAAVGVRQLLIGLEDRSLFRDGVLVDATIENIAGANRNVDRNIQQHLKLSFILPNETEKRTVEGFSTPMPGSLNRFDIIKIRVDPKDLNRWTERPEPVAWSKALVVPIILAPFALLLLGLVALKRSAFAKVYRNGSAFTANVIGVQRSALVPGQRIVKIALAGGEGRVLQVTMPTSVAPEGKGATLQALASDINAGRAIAIDAYR